MSALQAQFEVAIVTSRSLRVVRKEDQLKLYSLYHQAKIGDVSGRCPGFTNVVNRAKYRAWEQLRGTSRHHAMQQFVTLTESLSNRPIAIF
ncbi:MAG: acyl-CoA-binding protein [Candidatus Promineifilaceae bacterium]